jgi:hypothetical protein
VSVPACPGGADQARISPGVAERGATDVDAVVVREGKNLKGRVLAIAIGIIGQRVLEQALGKTVKAIEARNYGTTETELT